VVKIDVPHVFRVFAGARGLLTLLDRHCPGHGLVYNTVQMWRGRQIPTKWIAAVFYCIEREGHSCLEFLVDDDEFTAAPAPRPRNARSRG